MKNTLYKKKNKIPCKIDIHTSEFEKVLQTITNITTPATSTENGNDTKLSSKKLSLDMLGGSKLIVQYRPRTTTPGDMGLGEL